MWDHKLGFVYDFKPKFSLKKSRKMQTDQKMVAYYFKKMGFFFILRALNDFFFFFKKRALILKCKELNV